MALRTYPTRSFLVTCIQRVFLSLWRCCRPEYEALLPQQGEEYLDALPKNERTKQPGYKQYTKRMRSLRFYTSVHMLETAGAHIWCLSQATLACDFLLYPISVGTNVVMLMS